MNIIACWNKNFDKLVEEDVQAKQNDKLVGRYVKQQINDGYAFYKIIKENKTTVVVKVIRNIGDDYIIPYWGERASLDKKFVIRNIALRDSLDSVVLVKK